MKPILYSGQIFEDNRGKLIAFNDFDLTRVSRLYIIQPHQGLIRAWQGHRLETKWFFVTKGCFEIKIVPASGENEFQKERMQTFVISHSDFQVLEIPGGHLNGFRALEPESSLQVFSEFNLEQGKADDFRVDIQTLIWDQAI